MPFEGELSKLLARLLLVLLIYTPWPNKNASILFGIIFQNLIHKNEKSFHNNYK